LADGRTGGRWSSGSGELSAGARQRAAWSAPVGARGSLGAAGRMWRHAKAGARRCWLHWRTAGRFWRCGGGNSRHERLDPLFKGGDGFYPWQRRQRRGGGPEDIAPGDAGAVWGRQRCTPRQHVSRAAPCARGVGVRQGSACGSLLNRSLVGPARPRTAARARTPRHKSAAARPVRARTAGALEREEGRKSASQHTLTAIFLQNFELRDKNARYKSCR
jgi:hypothetical protein